MAGSGRRVTGALAFVVVIVGHVGWACAQATNGSSVVLVDAVVASVDGVPITLVDLEEFESGPGRLLSPDERSSRSAVLEAMVVTRLFQAEFDKRGIRASDGDVNTYIDNLIAENNSSREAIRHSLAQIGATWEQYFERMRQELQRMALLNREIRARVNVTPEEVERAWREDPQYSKPERLEIGHIFVPVGSAPDAHAQAQARADEAYDAARRNFGKAAKKYSEGPNAEDGGILGTFRKNEMASSFVDAIEDLEPGDVARPFAADGAFHIVKLIRIVPPERMPLEDVRENIEEKLYNENLDARYKRWIEEDLRKRHHVTVQFRDLDALMEASRS